MSGINTSYDNQPIALNGLIFDLSPKDCVSRAADERIPFGRLVSAGATPGKSVKLPLAAIDITDEKKAQGVSVHTHTVENQKNTLAPGHPKGDIVNVLKEQRIYVKVEDAVTPDSDVFIRFKGKDQTQTIEWDADFVTGNLVDGKINNVAIAQVPFNSDQATTLADVATEIESNAKVKSATVTDTREITVISETDELATLSDFVVTGGAGQAVDTIAETQALVSSLDRGIVRSDDDQDLGSNPTAAQLPNAKFDQGANAGELAVLQLDL